MYVAPWALEMGVEPRGVARRGNGPSAQLGKGEGEEVCGVGIVIVVVVVVDIVRSVV